MNGRKKLSIRLTIFVLMLVLASGVPAAAVIHYVDPNGSADFTTIQAAIDDPCTVNGDEIEVGPGTYGEAINFIGKAVRLYSSGGAEVTTIDANGIAGAYHVVKCVSGEDANTILEGFTITGGNANGPASNDYFGGGMYNSGSSPTVTDCTFRGNSADYDGGGMYNYTGETSLLITEIGTAAPRIIEIQNVNSTSEDTSGWIVLVNDASYSIDAVNSIGWSLPSSMAAGQVLYRTDNPGDNYWGSNIDWDTTGPGWAMIVDGTGNIRDFMVWGYSSAEIASLSIDFGGFSNISIGSAWSGDGSPFNHSGDYSFKRVGTSDNDSAVDFVLTTPHSRGEENAALSTPFSSSPTVTNCTFSGNTAYNGGGMYNNGSNPTVTDCIFTGNIADYGGGGMGNENGSNPIVTSCTFIGNIAYGGGGMGNENNSNPIVTNCTFSGNTADYGGGIGNVSSSPTVTNCILWGNEPDEIYNDSSTSPVTFSDIQGGWGDPCDNNINADPLFVDAAGGDWHLKDFSPCVDAGNNNAVPAGVTTDLDGNPRFVDDANMPDTGSGTVPIVDMGAYERQISSFGPICNVTHGVYYLKIQAAIDAASNGDWIEVAPGTYGEAINFNGKAVRLYSSGGPEVTTIDGTGHDHVVQCISGEDANTILEGFTITGGNANGPEYNGGGMYNSGSSPTVTNCTFSGNSAAMGGGMYNENNSSPTVTNCNFTGNSASLGGGMYNENNSSPTVTNCNFIGNWTGDFGYGGGMSNNNSNPTVTNCTFSGNSAAMGGGMFNHQSSPTVTNCNFINNTSEDQGGGMYSYQNSPTVTNCILWGNEPDEIYINASNTTVTYSDVEDGCEGLGNINADPGFIDAVSGDFRLGFGSPCIDAGDNTSVPSSVLKDLAGKLRFADDPYTTPDTGNAGTNGRPVVDMGAYEFQGCGTISQNLLANPGFETGDATGWMANWGLAADTNQVHEGNYSGLASGRTASWDGAWQSLLGLMDDGKTYRISGWVMLQNADSNYVQLTVKKTDLGGTNFYFIDNATGFDDQWVHLDGTLALDVNGQPTELFVYFEGPAADVNFYVDDAAVTEVMGEMNHNGGVDFFDFSLFASYYGFDCTTQDCGRANLYDCDNAINERDLAILVRDWLVGAEP